MNYTTKTRLIRLHLPPVVRRWRLVAAVMGAASLIGGGVLFAAPSNIGAAQAFHPVTSTRVLDTRGGSGAPLGPGETLDVVIPGLPDDATAAAINLTVVDGTEGSFLTLYPTGELRTTTSSINWLSPGAVANSAIVRIGVTHSIRAFNLKGSVHVVMDLIGYYAASPEGGSPGPAGLTGPQGSVGQPGVAGTDGIDGADGVNGVNGTPGQPGTPGNDAVAGPAGSVYLYAYNTVAETVLSGAAVSFGSAGPSSPPAPNGIVFTAPGAGFLVSAAGAYKVTFSVIGAEENQMSIRINNHDPAGGAMSFGAFTAHRPTVGTAVLTLAAGDSLTLANLSSGSGGTGNITLDASVGGTAAAINAWILIEQLNVN